MAGYDTYFGFNTTQKQTLENLLAANSAGPATTSVRGTVLQAAPRADVTPATDGTAVGTAFNDLLAKLRTAGVLAVATP